MARDSLYSQNGEYPLAKHYVPELRAYQTRRNGQWVVEISGEAEKRNGHRGDYGRACYAASQFLESANR